MTTTELRDFIKSHLPDWDVTINEQYAVNVQADDQGRFDKFIYVEEFARARVSYAKYGRDAQHTHDIYLCVLGEFDTTAEQREQIRQERIMPSVRKIEDALNRYYGVQTFDEDFEPRGFDAHEILVHIQFKVSGKRC